MTNARQLETASQWVADHILATVTQTVTWMLGDAEMSETSDMSAAYERYMRSAGRSVGDWALWYIVSEQGAYDLVTHGECVLNLGNDPEQVWGRFTLGQRIVMDDVVQRIACPLVALQRHTDDLPALCAAFNGAGRSRIREEGGALFFCDGGDETRSSSVAKANECLPLTARERAEFADIVRAVDECARKLAVGASVRVTWVFDEEVAAELVGNGLVEDPDDYYYEDFIRDMKLPSVVDIDKEAWALIEHSPNRDEAVDLYISGMYRHMVRSFEVIEAKK